MADPRDSSAQIEQNRLLHNRIADRYQHIHDDIFNAHEQARIRGMLSKVRGELAASSPVALDFGCGSGNMTNHLRALGFAVVSADISDRFVERIRERYKADPLVTPYLLSGGEKDLQEHTFDSVCIYSVLHHLPDYLSVLRRLVKRVAPGGFVYIDHEASDAFWNDEAPYLELQRRTRFDKLRANWKKLFSWSYFETRYRMMKDPRYQPEGDIHVWKDDHIEWQSVRRVLAQEGFAEIYSQDYLAYRPHYPLEIFQQYASRTSDMHCSLFRRRD